jgi:hypothetical protein
MFIQAGLFVMKVRNDGHSHSYDEACILSHLKVCYFRLADRWSD